MVGIFDGEDPEKWMMNEESMEPTATEHRALVILWLS